MKMTAVREPDYVFKTVFANYLHCGKLCGCLQVALLWCVIVQPHPGVFNCPHDIKYHKVVDKTQNCHCVTHDQLIILW